jgi:hypothetical protein
MEISISGQIVNDPLGVLLSLAVILSEAKDLLGRPT